jgi:hypothetical protein
LQVPKCEDFGSKGHPSNVVYLKPQELPPANRLPKCPCCGLEMKPVKPDRGDSKPWRLYAGIGIAALFVLAVIALSMWPSPPPPTPSVEGLLKEVWPSLR